MPDSSGGTANREQLNARAAPWLAGCLSTRKPPDWGTSLTDDDYRMLEASWIPRDLADAALLRRVQSFEGREIIGQKGNRDCAGILIASYWPGDASAFNHSIRRDNPEWTTGKDGKPKPQGKYLGPPKGANRLYIPPGVTPEQLANVRIPIVLAEGAKKGLALWRLANHESRTPPIHTDCNSRCLELARHNRQDGRA